MKLSLIQFEPQLFNVEFNSQYIEEKIRSINSDILVFPELATTGYFFQNKEESGKYAEQAGGDTISRFQKLASEFNKIVVVGFAEKDGEKIFNSAALIFPDKSKFAVYRKTHLFYKERFAFDEGDTGFFVVDYPDFDIKIGPMICYDWRFPESARSLALQGADLIVCPSNLVTELWHLVMPARAIENKVYLAVANRIGRETRNDEELFFNSKSAVYAFNGDCLAVAGIEDENVLTVDIEPNLTRNKSFNSINHLFKDRRPEIYKL